MCCRSLTPVSGRMECEEAKANTESADGAQESSAEPNDTRRGHDERTASPRRRWALGGSRPDNAFRDTRGNSGP